MLENYDQIIENHCHAQVVCRPDNENNEVAKEACISVAKEYDEQYAAVPECEQYKKIHTALLYKCQADFVKEYGKAYCDGKVDDQFFPFMAAYCHSKYTSNANAFEQKTMNCVCRHLDVYQNSDLEEYRKNIIINDCKNRR